MTSSVFALPRFPADGAALDPDSVFVRALDARDPRFDGVFFVGITSTRVYCRPICPARVSYNDHRRFFRSAAAAERAGFRPCLRCRPELAPGRAACDALARLAHAAAERIADGALNGRSVAELAHDLGVSERHLRRALEQEIGVSPLELAQTHRLLLARRLLADTVLPVTRVAYASGFQSLRRFNDAFRAHYGMPPSAVRRPARPPLGAAPLRLTLAYRPPLAWDELLAVLARDAVPGVDLVDGRRYATTVGVDGHVGIVTVEDVAPSAARRDAGSRGQTAHLVAHVSQSLVPVLMPLLSRLRHLLDLDAEPAAIDAHLTRSGLGSLVARRPGLRVPGAVDGFDVALRVILGRKAARVFDALGERLDTDSHPEERSDERSARTSCHPEDRRDERSARTSCHPEERSDERSARASCHPEDRRDEGSARISSALIPSALITRLDRLPPSPTAIVGAGVDRLVDLGVHPRYAQALVSVARSIVDGTLRLQPGRSIAATHRALAAIPGIGTVTATTIIARALDWPDAFPTMDRALIARAELWRPWRAYAALHLRLAELETVALAHSTEKAQNVE